jgi:hypothetical protein
MEVVFTFFASLLILTDCRGVLPPRSHLSIFQICFRLCSASIGRLKLELQQSCLLCYPRCIDVYLPVELNPELALPVSDPTGKGRPLQEHPGVPSRVTLLNVNECPIDYIQHKLIPEARHKFEVRERDCSVYFSIQY